MEDQENLYPGRNMQQILPGSLSNRSSVTYAMPMVAEDGSINRAIPKTPLRVPQKNARRSLPLNNPTPYVEAKEADQGSAGDVSPSPMSPHPSASDYYRESSAGLYSGQVTPQVTEFPDQEEKFWFANRNRTCRFLAIVAVSLVLILSLALGLGIGLSKKSPSHETTSGDAPTADFPVGSYSIDTSLRNTTTDCTTRPTTWRCIPNAGGSVVFHWTIEAKDATHYIVSAKDSPLTPPFSGLRMAMLDRGKANERLSLSFGMNKTVVPVDALTPTNRVANCTYEDTTFQALLYTRRKGNDTIDPASSRFSFTSWPGDVEITQFKNSTVGSPLCVDKGGVNIADVQATGLGSCECRYDS